MYGIGPINVQKENPYGGGGMSGSGIASSIIGGLFSARGQSKANKANIALARENRAWQEKMSNTAYQRASRDLDRAGLNRILALGSPASTPAGNQAVVGNVGKEGVDGATKAGATALQMRIQTKRLVQELKNMRAVENKDKAIARKEDYQGDIAKHSVPEQEAMGNFWREMQTQGSTAKGMGEALKMMQMMKFLFGGVGK